MDIYGIFLGIVVDLVGFVVLFTAIDYGDSYRRRIFLWSRVWWVRILLIAMAILVFKLNCWC